MLTGEIEKEKKFVYCRCTGNRSECDLPRFREEDFAETPRRVAKGSAGAIRDRATDRDDIER
jgi:hypothetical protein